MLSAFHFLTIMNMIYQLIFEYMCIIFTQLCKTIFHEKHACTNECYVTVYKQALTVPFPARHQPGSGRCGSLKHKVNCEQLGNTWEH